MDLITNLSTKESISIDIQRDSLSIDVTETHSKISKKQKRKNKRRKKIKQDLDSITINTISTTDSTNSILIDLPHKKKNKNIDSISFNIIRPLKIKLTPDLETRESIIIHKRKVPSFNTQTSSNKSTKFKNISIKQIVNPIEYKKLREIAPFVKRRKWVKSNGVIGIERFFTISKDDFSKLISKSFSQVKYIEDYESGFFSYILDWKNTESDYISGGYLINKYKNFIILSDKQKLLSKNSRVWRVYLKPRSKKGGRGLVTWFKQRTLDEFKNKYHLLKKKFIELSKKYKNLKNAKF